MVMVEGQQQGGATNRGVGHPCKYDPDYCRQLVEHMEKGLSFTSFAGVIRCSMQTLYSYTKRFPEFMEAKETGTALCQLFWERMGIMGVGGKIQGFNTAAWIFNMKNRFNWTDKHELTQGDETVKIEFNYQKPLSQKNSPHAGRLPSGRPINFIKDKKKREDVRRQHTEALEDKPKRKEKTDLNTTDMIRTMHDKDSSEPLELVIEHEEENVVESNIIDVDSFEINYHE